LKNKKSKSYGILKRKLDKVFSIYIRQKDAGAYGQAICVSCGAVARWQSMHCGHFIPRHYLAARWNILNCFVQCPGCNLFKRGNYPGFASFLNRTYGPERIEDLMLLKRESVKYRQSDIQTMINEYTEKLKELPSHSCQYLMEHE